MREITEIIGNTLTTPIAIQSDWNQSKDTELDFIKNKPDILTENDVKQIIAEVGGGGGGGTTVISIQADWAEDDDSKSSYILNKPKILTESEIREIVAETDDGNITVDDALSNTSENPVQNKVITENLNRIEKLARIQVMLDLVDSEDEVAGKAEDILTQSYDYAKSGDFLIIRVPNGDYYKDFVHILRQESPMVRKMWHLLTVYNTAGSGGGGGTIEGVVEPEPDTISKRNESGSLFAFNSDIDRDNPEYISDYVEDNEVITCKVLKQYAVPFPRDAIHRPRGAIGYDGVGDVVVHQIDDEVTEDSENLITSGAVYDAIQDISADGAEIVVDDQLSTTSENPVQNKVITEALNNKQDKLTIDTVVKDGSNNPVTSDAVHVEVVKLQGELNSHVNSYNQRIGMLESADESFYQMIQSKQDKLTFDSTPTQNSTNPVTSGGVYSAIQNIQPSGGGETVEGSVEPEPDTIAQRDASGSLFAFNGDIGSDNPADIEGYVQENEVITCKILKQYAVPLTPNHYYSNGVIGFDGEGGTRTFDVLDHVNGSAGDALITSAAVSDSFSTFAEYVGENYVDKSTVEKEVMDSDNPISAGAVNSKLSEFSNAYDKIIDDHKEEAVSEAKQYTDEKIAKISASIIDGVLKLELD